MIEPAFARVEVACALSRIMHDPERAEHFTATLYASGGIEEVALNPVLLERALHRGAEQRLRGSDALYLATAEIHGAELISWDREHIVRAGAVSPEEWLAKNAV
jgi:predicted nucleic acid-binding protein